MDVQNYYDDFSHRYEDERHLGYHALIDEIEAGLVRERLHGGRVLEVGCGTGLVLSRVSEGAELAAGADISRGILAAARERDLDVVHADGLSLPYKDDTFDVVYSFKVLAHIPAIEQALAEMTRVTRPGGLMLPEFYNPLSLRYLAKRAAGPRRTGTVVTESDVSTRWDPPWRISRYLPENVELIELRGVRVFTPVAAALKVPVLRRVLGAVERLASSHPAPAPFGGFLIAVLRKR